MTTGYLNAYRILVWDLIIITMAEENSGWRSLAEAMARARPAAAVVAAVLRPRPLETVAGRRIAFFTTAPAPVHQLQASHLREVYGAEVALVSGNLADREALWADVERARDVDAFVTEVKGAAIDVVAEAGSARGSRSCSRTTTCFPLSGQANLDEESARWRRPPRRTGWPHEAAAPSGAAPVR